MAQIPSQTKNKIMAQLGLSDDKLIDQMINDAAKGTRYENPSQTKNSIFFNTFWFCFRLIFQFFVAAFGVYVTNRLIRYSSGAALAEHMAEHKLTTFLGEKSRHRLRLVKDSSVTFDVEIGTKFFVGEANARRFQTLQKFTAVDGTTELLIEVEALDIGSKYNCSANLITYCESALSVTSISNIEILTYGQNADTEQISIDRIISLKAGEIDYGVEDKYITLIKSAGGISAALLDNVDDEGIHYFTLFGESGPVSQSVADNAQIVFDARCMTSDRAVMLAASPQPLALTISIDNTYDETTIRSQIDAYLGTIMALNFESSLLVDHITDHITQLENRAIRISPEFMKRGIGKYWVPTVNFEEFGYDEN
ncbi:MAG: baseplate J/gp47 family protein [Acinetobacter sp.]|nr:baseplate J/gp47 family protein [Acinetobacter sp.]